jgi:hypothetical protein
MVAAPESDIINFANICIINNCAYHAVGAGGALRLIAEEMDRSRTPPCHYRTLLEICPVLPYCKTTASFAFTQNPSPGLISSSRANPLLSA